MQKGASAARAREVLKVKKLENMYYKHFIFSVWSIFGQTTHLLQYTSILITENLD